MSWFSRAPRQPDPEIVAELRSVARRLIGWEVTGSSSVDLDSLLRRAADEITLLAASATDDCSQSSPVSSPRRPAGETE
jgi:hypothetical protein